MLTTSSLSSSRSYRPSPREPWWRRGSMPINNTFLWCWRRPFYLASLGLHHENHGEEGAARQLITLPLMWYFPVMLTPTSLSRSCRPLPREPWRGGASRQSKSPPPLPTESLTCDVDAELVILVLNLHGGGGHHENHGEAGAASRPHAPPPPSWGWLRDVRHN